MGKINLKTLVKVIFSIGLILFLIFNLDTEKIKLIRFDTFLPFTLSLVISLTSMSIMSFRWKLFISEFLGENVVFRNLYKYYIIAAFFNIFLPGAIGGDVVRTQRLSRKNNIKIKDATGITLGERFSGVFGLLILLSFSFLFLNFPEGLKFDNYLPIWIFRISPLMILICIPVLKFFLSKYRLKSSYFFLIEIIAISLVAQLGDITIAYIFSKYFELSIPFSAFLFIMPLVYIATVLPISLGGLGVREGAFSGLMILYGVDYSIAIMISLLMYLVKVGVGIIGYFIYLKEK